MKRQTFDQWRVPNSELNRNETFYVHCDCGELATQGYGKYYYVCSHCRRNYVKHLGGCADLRNTKP